MIKSWSRVTKIIYSLLLVLDGVIGVITLGSKITDYSLEYALSIPVSKGE